MRSTRKSSALALIPKIVIASLILLVGILSPSLHAQGNWAMPGHDAQRTGRANFAGPTAAPSSPSWSFPTAAPIVGDITTSAEGNLYFASDKLYALKPDGTALVPPAPIGAPVTCPAVDDNAGLVYIVVSSADGGFDLLSFTKQLQGGTVLVHVPKPPFGGAVSPLLVGDGNVYFVAGRFPGIVYAAGATPWSYPYCTGEAGPSTPSGVSANAPALSADGASLFVVCSGSLPEGFFRLNPFTGAKITSTTSQTNSTEPVIDSFQHIRSGWQAFGGATFCGDFLTWDLSLTLLTPPASVCDSSRFTTSRAAILPDGFSTARIGFAFPPNNQLDATGANTWTITTDNSTIPNFTSVPAVDAAGNIFIGNSQGIQARSSVDGHTLWSFTTGNAITTQPVIANGGALYAGSSSGVVYGFNTQSKNAAGTVYVSSGAVVDLSIASIAARFPGTTGVLKVSPDGSRIYESGTFGMDVIDSTTNKVITTVPVGSQPLWIDISPDGSRIYVSQPNIPSAPGVLQGVYVVDAATNAITASIGIPGPERVAVAPDNSRVYVGSQGRGIAIIDPATDTVTGSISILGANLTGIAFTPDSARAYVGEASGPFLYQIDARANSLINTVTVTGALGGGVGAVIASPDGSKIYAGNDRSSPFDPAHNVFVLNTATNTVTAQIPVSFPSEEMALSTDGANVLIGDSDTGTLIAASTTTDSVVESLPVTDPCCHTISGIATASPAALQPPAIGTINVITNNANASFTIAGLLGTFAGAGLNFTQIIAPGAYTITFNSLPGFIPPPAQHVAVSANQTLTVFGIYLVPQPSISGILPGSGTRGQEIPGVQINGQNFRPAASVSFSGGIEVTSLEFISETELKATLLIPRDAPLGPQDVTVDNGCLRECAGPPTVLSNAFEVKRRPVIVIPGIMGSFLQNSQGDTVWLDPGDLKNLDCDKFLFPLALDKNGTDPAPFIGRQCLGVVISGQGAPLVPAGIFDNGTDTNFYGPLVASLAQYSPVKFAYDWRLDFQLAARHLRALIEQYAPNPWDRVDIVAHSQGGLVARTYAAMVSDGLLGLNANDKRVDTIVYLGTPHRGSPKSFAILSGWQDYEKFFGSFINKHFNFTTLVDISANFTAAYELLPRDPFYEQDFVEIPADQTIATLLPNDELVTRERSLWSTLLASPPVSPRSFEINGSGQNTFVGIKAQSGVPCMDVKAETTGDGTVPSASAQLPLVTNLFVNENHGDLPRNPVVDSILPKLLDGTPPESLLSDPAYQGILQSTPFGNKSEYIAGHTCSPVVIQVVNSIGAVTGFDGDRLLTEIPNSDFFRFTENEAVILAANDSYSVNLSATDNGTFTLAFETRVSQVALRSAVFRDIPITARSRAHVSIDGSLSSAVLQVDLDGDGNSDYSVEENTDPSARSYVQTLLQLIGLLMLPRDKSQDLTELLRGTVRAIDRSDTTESRERLQSFIRKVDAQAGKAITTKQSSLLIKLTQLALNRL